MPHAAGISGRPCARVLPTAPRSMVAEAGAQVCGVLRGAACWPWRVGESRTDLGLQTRDEMSEIGARVAREPPRVAQPAPPRAVPRRRQSDDI